MAHGYLQPRKISGHLALVDIPGTYLFLHSFLFFFHSARLTPLPSGYNYTIPFLILAAFRTYSIDVTRMPTNQPARGVGLQLTS